MTATENNNVLVKLVNKFDMQTVSNVEFCRELGFTQEEIEYVKMLWDPAFNKSMIYLSDEIILNNLTEDTSKDAVRSFYNNKLINKYEHIVDYIEITVDHPLVQTYLKTVLKTPKHNKRFFAVTGECFKCLLLDSPKGRAFRKYYIKVEQAACLMHQYLCEINKAKADFYCESIATFLKDLKESKLNREPQSDGFIYIASSDQYMKEDKYKVGATLDPDARISSLNTSHDIEDSMVILKTYAMPMYKQCEKLVHAVLDKYRISKRREFFNIKYTKLVQIMDELLVK